MLSNESHAYGTNHHLDSQSRLMLQRITDGWTNRAKVRRDPVHLDFDPDLPDFLENLLPFHQHPKFQALSTSDRQKILSSGWLIYNDKTVAIETAIVTPSCYDALEGRIPGLGSGPIKSLAEVQIG